MAHAGAIIKNKRESLGMSRRELAIRAGINPSHLGRIERDEVDPKLSTVRRLARALGLSVLESGVEAVITPVEDATPGS